MFLCRVEDWPDRLQMMADMYERTPFEYGRTDCAHFAADCVKAVTGRDVLGRFRGAYASRLEARARLKALGYPGTSAAVGDALRAVGGHPVPPACAMVGDIGVSAGGTILVRFAGGFQGRDARGLFGVARPAVAFTVGW